MNVSDENNNMTAQAQAAVLDESEHPQSVDVSFTAYSATAAEAIEAEQLYRASAYGMIAALLRESIA